MFCQTKIAKLQLFLPNISPTRNLIFVSMAHMLRSLHDFVVNSQEIWPFQGFESLDATNHDQSDGGMVISTWCRNAWERKPWIIYSGITWVFPKIGVPMGTPKWMVYNGKPYSKWMIWVYHYFRKHPHRCSWRFYMNSICLYWQELIDGTWWHMGVDEK